MSRAYALGTLSGLLAAAIAACILLALGLPRVQPAPVAAHEVAAIRAGVPALLRDTVSGATLLCVSNRSGTPLYPLLDAH